MQNKTINSNVHSTKPFSGVTLLKIKGIWRVHFVLSVRLILNSVIMMILITTVPFIFIKISVIERKIGGYKNDRTHLNIHSLI